MNLFEQMLRKVYLLFAQQSILSSCCWPLLANRYTTSSLDARDRRDRDISSNVRERFVQGYFRNQVCSISLSLLVVTVFFMVLLSIGAPPRGTPPHESPALSPVILLVLAACCPLSRLIVCTVILTLQKKDELQVAGPGKTLSYRLGLAAAGLANIVGRCSVVVTLLSRLRTRKDLLSFRFCGRCGVLGCFVGQCSN